MENRTIPFTRAEQILKVLARQGPLSVTGLQRILAPAIHRRNLRDALKRLHRKGLLEKRCDHAYGTVYHYISDNPKAVSLLTRWLKLPGQELRVPCFRHIELLHSQECAVWFYRLQRLFPQATVLREHEFPSNEAATHALLSSLKDRDRRPDLMILLPSSVTRRFVTVGVEIERFLKSKKRLAQKLERFARRSTLDGLIYVCDSETIATALRSVYRSRVLKPEVRVNHYGNDFLLFAEPGSSVGNGEILTRNAALRQVPLAAWMHQLAATQFSLRRDACLT